MQTLTVKDFNLKLTLESGQFFRYRKFSDFYFINTGNKVFSIRQNKNNLIFNSVSKHFIQHFFGLNENYKKIVRGISKDKLMSKLIKKNHGLRLIQQEPWECMMSYVCSSASNIPKIKKNVELLSQHFGERVKVGGYVSFTFPKIGKINHLGKIKDSKTGYRANYLHKLNKYMNKNRLNHLNTMDYEDAHKILTQLPGIGPKVADCVALFSLGHTKAFPVDVWIKHIMEKHYFNDKPTSIKKIKQFAQNYFGEYAGYAQMFLYMLRR